MSTSETLNGAAKNGSASSIDVTSRGGRGALSSMVDAQAIGENHGPPPFIHVDLIGANPLSSSDKDDSLISDAANNSLSIDVGASANDSLCGDAGSISLISYHELTILLAGEVRNHPCLYGDLTEDEKFDKRGAKKAAWRDVSAKIGLSPDECQRRFKNIRDRFVKSLKAYESTGDPPKWKYFSLLTYLKDSIRRRPVPIDHTPPHDYSRSMDDSLDSLSSSQITHLTHPVSKAISATASLGSVAFSTDAGSTGDLVPATGVAPAVISSIPAMLPTAVKRKTPVQISSPLTAKRLHMGSATDRAITVATATAAGGSDCGGFGGEAAGQGDNGDMFPVRHKDHLDLFTASIGCQMRQLSDQAADLAKVRIQQVLFEVKYQALSGSGGGSSTSKTGGSMSIQSEQS